MQKFKWLTKDSRTFLSRGYLKKGQTVEERVREISDRAEQLSGIEGFSDKFFDYMSKGWISLSSPVWSNYGNDKGLPVSCFGSFISDSMESILLTHAEVGMLSKFGGGTSGYFGALRPRGSEIKDNGESSGAVHFMELFDKLTDVVSQGSVRRGYFSAYLDIEHDDFYEFIGVGTEGHPIQNLTTGVCVSDSFMQKVLNKDKEACKRWAKVIQSRSEVGFPYIFWTDTVNKNKPDVFSNRKIYASNMCSEIALPSNEDETFVCVLSSVNLLHYDEWKDTDLVETLTIFLDTVCTEFLGKIIQMYDHKPNACSLLQKASNFCRKYRALGLGVLGFHSYLQSKMIPFESREAAKWNLEMIKLIREKAEKASEGKNATLIAIAPTKSSSFILGNVSQGIEPEFSNFYIKDLAKIKVTQKNKYLEALLEDKGKNDEKTWNSIKMADGSVQHLDFLTQEEKDVFKTFIEINPETVIDYASVRQEYIDQSQSVNLMVDPNLPVKDINALYIRAWQSGLKTLYYQYNLNAAQAMQREKYMKKGCSACEG